MSIHANPLVEIILINKDTKLTYGSDMAAGLDLYHMGQKTIELHPGQVDRIPTGIAIFLNEMNLVGLCMPRSGLGSRGLVLGNLTGVIDADYQGEMFLTAWNRNLEGEPLIIAPGDKVAQYLVMPVVHPTFAIVQKFSAPTGRGGSGFGSTGHR